MPSARVRWSRSSPRSRSTVAAVRSGRACTVAHDCGLIINPDGLRSCIAGNVVQGSSRDIAEAPEAVDIVLINRPELSPAGAGESSIRPVAAALANAVFDASGLRLRRVPLTSHRLMPALA
jgi:CO/xanthine dehydrogenase Mo-binding subunit